MDTMAERRECCPTRLHETHHPECSRLKEMEARERAEQGDVQAQIARRIEQLEAAHAANSEPQKPTVEGPAHWFREMTEPQPYTPVALNEATGLIYKLRRGIVELVDDEIISMSRGAELARMNLDEWRAFIRENLDSVREAQRERDLHAAAVARGRELRAMYWHGEPPPEDEAMTAWIAIGRYVNDLILAECELVDRNRSVRA